MSYSSLSTQITDIALNGRVVAAVQKEAFNNSEFSDTDYANALKTNQANAWTVFGWPVCIATETQYEYAMNSGNQSPGNDPTVITDEEILSAVQANWPSDPWPPVTGV